MKKYILNWIKEVSKLRPELNGFAICPFAAKAKYKIIQCSIEELYLYEDYDVIIYVVEDYLDLNAIELWINYYNQTYQTWDFFGDCATYDTFINGVQTNNGKYNLILAQPKEKLKKFRKALSKTTYYDLWDKNYLEEILSENMNIIQS